MVRIVASVAMILGSLATIVASLVKIVISLVMIIVSTITIVVAGVMIVVCVRDNGLLCEYYGLFGQDDGGWSQLCTVWSQL